MAKPRGHFFWAIACAAAFLAAVGCNRSAPDSDSKSNIEQALSASRTSVTDVGNTPSVDGGSTCTGILGAATFQRAICSCDAIHASAHLATDGFDSSKGPPNGGLGGSVGSNNGEAWSAHVSIGGDLATPASLQASASSEVRGNLDLGGTLTAGPPFTVDGNARVVKPLPHNVTVRGTVTHLSSVAAPCDCSHIIPIAAMVAAHRARANDDAAIGLSANAATGSNPARIDLPSGNYYLARIQTGRPLTIFAHGHTALYVDGDVTASTPLRFQLDPTATLDLFVAGNVASSAAFTLGSASSPAHCRAYFAGVSFDMSAGATIGCNVYAPAAQFDTSASGDVHGSLFVGNFNASANASVHYDVSIRNAGGECCTAQACDDGNPCTVDSCKGDGTCSHAPAANGTVCHGANKCEQTFTCQNGACSGSDPVMCVASDACHVAGTCDPATGACSNPAAADGTICNDGNACTQTDTCTAGTCTGANPVVCTASDQCHLAGTCDPANGLCKNPAAPDGTPCDDGNACTTGDSCAAGACKGGSAVPVDDGNPCTTDSCDPVSGVKHVPVPAGTSCSDGNACNGAETC
ncbi:MAG TPA: hypothetical protein VGY54_08200, partial [Polyangiaceae bacterium]|nr:hypothetical protein [Polyangiaceae bacterium]